MSRERKTFIIGWSVFLVLTAGAAIAQPRTVPGSVDAEFEKINQDVPGFGGMFYDADGTLKIYLTHPDKPGLLKSVVGDDAEILQGRYEFRQLQGWRVRLRDVLSFSGVTSLDVDESVNQVRIGLDPGARRASAQQVRRQMRQLGIPKAAVRFEAREAMIPMQTTVQGSFNPVPGGVQINYPGFLCTLGFNVQVEEACYFFTNDHCSATSGQNDQTPYFQPLSPRFIGTEVRDPPFFTGAGCPAGSVCRFSDAAAARYEDPTIPCEFGSIARTPVNSLNLDNPNRWTIVSKQQTPIMGQLVAKQGRTTGRTEGTVVATCVDTGVSGSNIVRLCQAFVTNNGQVVVQGGDSGSPVFRRRLDSSRAQLVGILWGGNGPGTQFVYSPMENIETDFNLTLPVF